MISYTVNVVLQHMALMQVIGGDLPTNILTHLPIYLPMFTFTLCLLTCLLQCWPIVKMKQLMSPIKVESSLIIQVHVICQKCHSMMVVTQLMNWCKAITSFDDKWQHVAIDRYVRDLSKCLAKLVKGLPKQATQDNWHMASYLSTYYPRIHLQTYLSTHI